MEICAFINILLRVDDTRTRILLQIFFFQAEDGIRDVERSRGLGDVYKRQVLIVKMDYLRRVVPPS